MKKHLTKSTAKLFLLVLSISSFALHSIATGNTIYLIGEHHDNTHDQELLVSLSEKAKFQKLLLGLELPDTESINKALSNLNSNGPAYIFPLEHTYARIVSHLLYFYSYLTKIEYLYQIYDQSALPRTMRDKAYASIPIVWNDRLCFPAMQESFDLLIDSHHEWNLWENIEKGSFFTHLTQALAKHKDQLGHDETSRSHFWLDRKITYSKARIISLLDELRPILVQLIEKVLASPEADLMPQSLKDNLNKTDTFLRNARPTEWDMVTNFGKFANKADTINNILGDRLRDFYIAFRLQKLATTAASLKLPLLAVTGMDHTPGIYMFLKKMGASVEVGLKNNFLQLPQSLAAYAKAGTLPALMQKRFTLFPSLALNSADLEAYFDEEKTDPTAVATLKVIKKHHDEL